MGVMNRIRQAAWGLVKMSGSGLAYEVLNHDDSERIRALLKIERLLREAASGYDVKPLAKYTEKK